MYSKRQIEKMIEKIKDKIEEKVIALFPVEGDKHTLELNEVVFGNTGALNNIEKQKELILKERSMTIPVRGDFVLWDNTTHEKIDEQRKQIMALPVLSDRLTYIVDGTEYQATDQLRLKAGAYTQTGESGVVNTHVNIGNKPPLKIYIEPESQLIYIRKGSTNISLYAFLKGLGINDAHMETYLGKEIVDTNRREKGHRSKKELEKFAKKVAYSDGDKPEEYRRDVKKWFEESEMDEETTEATLGKSFSHVNVDLLLESAKKTVDVLNDRAEEDDRDSLEFKKVLSVGDHIGEKIDQNIRKIEYQIKNNVDRHEEISKIISSNMFNDPVQKFFTTSDLSAAADITNPLAAISNEEKITIMGEGGISDSHQLTDDMIAINPSEFGFLDPVHTPESHKIGANLHLTTMAEKDGDTIKTKVWDISTGAIKKISPKEMVNATIAFPDQFDKSKKEFKSDKVKVLAKKDFKKVPKEEVDYVLLSSRGMFDTETNLIPFMQNTQGNRAMMGSKMQEQALSLKGREKPLVQSAVDEGNTSFEKMIGDMESVRAPFDGEILSVDPLKIKSTGGKEQEIETYKNFPMGHNSIEHHDVIVEVGDKVAEGDLLADSSYTKDGEMALGTNLKVAFTPYKGLTFEDGLVVSNSAAEKMTSEHIYKKEFTKEKNNILDLEQYITIYRNNLDADNVQKLDEDGVIKPGSKVEPGDILIAALREKKYTRGDKLLKNIHKDLAMDKIDDSVVWEKDVEGEVTDVVKSGKLIKVLVRTAEKSKVGDKVVGRYGNKGTISRVIPDADMPMDENDEPMEIILNPATVPSRMNPSQLLETAAGKIAEKTGEPYKVDNFSGEDFVEKIKKDMKKHGIKEKEILTDPEYGELENPVFTGKQYFMKLKHQTDKKFSARSHGQGYDINEQPLRGGEHSAQAMDIMTNYTLLAHGAKENLKEMSTIKGTKNDEFWRAFQFGDPLPEMEEPFVYDKFINMLEGTGVKINQRDTGDLQLSAMTDKDIESMSHGEIDDALIVKAKNLQEEKGGLFDPAVTGGRDAEDGHWSHIELEEPMPNPMFEDPIKKILGMTEREYKDVLKGNTEINGMTGGKAIQTALSEIDVDEELKKAKGDYRDTSSKSTKNTISKKIRYLNGLKKTEKDPKDYMLTKFPVIPPQFRPIYERPDGSLGVSDVNELYKHIILTNRALKKDKETGLLNEQEFGDERETIYESIAAVQGIHDPITQDARNRKRKGLLKEIGGGSGTQPKNAFFQNRVIRKRQDMSGRSIITPGPDLGVDQIGLPEDMAWEVYKPHIMRKLVTERNVPATQAKKEHWEKRSDAAKNILKEVMEDTPVIMNRAPSLHKFSTMAFKPQLIEGKAIQLPSLTVGGFNADFDGDQMGVHVPVTDEAKKEAMTKMLPSQNLFRPGHEDFMYMPSHEQILGLYQMSKITDKPLRGEFSSEQEALREYEDSNRSYDKKWSLAQPIKINNKKTTIGRLKLNEMLPTDHQLKRNDKMTKDFLSDMFKDLGEDEKMPNEEIVELAQELKDIGDKHAYKSGFTIGISDLDIEGKKEKQDMYEKAELEIEGLTDQKDIFNKFSKTENDITGMIVDKNPDNAIVAMAESGARGNMNNVRSILGGPGLLVDHKGNLAPVPVTKSYAEGVDTGDYWTSMYGARKGMIDRVKMTAKPGAFAKSLVNNTLDHIVTTKDCRTHDGKMKETLENEIKNRYLAADVRKDGEVIAERNDRITNGTFKDIKEAKIDRVKVRTPLKCEADDGVCSMCYGAFADGKPPSVGENIGVIAAHALTEPTTQMTMNAFHTGGVASGEKKESQGFERLEEILKVPKTLKNKATLAKTSGTVSRIEDTATGKKVHIAGKSHFIPSKLRVRVAEGEFVNKGDKLSEGTIKPQELLEYKGLDDTRDYLTNELKEVYDGRIRENTIETVVQKVTNNTRIEDPGDSDFSEGQYAPLNQVNHFNRMDKKKVIPEKALNHELAENTAGIQRGKKITEGDIERFKNAGINSVAVIPRKINHEVDLKGINTLPFTNEDWMGKMNFQRISGEFQRSAGEGAISKTDGTTNPIPAFARGINFGETPDRY